MPTHHVVRVPSGADQVNDTIKAHEKDGAGLIQVLPIVVGGNVDEVMLVFRKADDDTPRAAGFRGHAAPETPAPPSES